MAASLLNSKTSHHSRSTSWPSSPHPIDSKFDEQLRRLTSQTASTSSSLSHKISALQELYDCFDQLLQLPLNQQALAKDHSAKWVDNTLDRSLRLLDACTTTRDSLSQTKECLQQIQSALRRRNGSEFIITKEEDQYIKSRKEIKKSIQKTLKDLKSILKECSSVIEKRHGDLGVANAIKDIEVVTASIFDSLLTHIAATKAQSKKNSWSSITKFKNQHTVCESEAVHTGEFEEVNAAIHYQLGQKKKIDVEDLRSPMIKLEVIIQDLDKGLECLFRHLVKSRATILNILNL